MAYVDEKLNFGTPAISNSNTKTISTNVYNAGAAIMLFKSEGTIPYLHYSVSVSSDTTGLTIDVHATDQSDGDVDASEATTEIVASTGNITEDYKGAALGTATQRVQGNLAVRGQTVARQYYALGVTAAGTNADATAGDAYIVLDGPTNMLGPQESTPGT